MSGLATPAILPSSPQPAAGAVDWLEEAGLLEDQILGNARRTPGGEVIWLHPASVRGEAPRPARLGPSLYNGVTGVALFLAAMEHVEPRDGRRDCVLSALASPRHQLKNLVARPEAARKEHHPLGAFTGLGGYIYGFSLIGRWLGEPELISEAADIATLITPDRIAADDALDVMSGCAGAALALLALDRMSLDHLSPTGSLMGRAVACGDHLLARRAATDVGPRAWPCNGKPPRFGFAHGAAGIADCLARLSESTGERRFREAAEEGIAFEHLHYDAERGDWPLFEGPEPSFMSSWCNGAPGIALGRLGVLAIDGAGHEQQDLHEALRITQAPASRMVHSLCCGSMGRAEILLHAYEVLGEDRLLQAAREIASQIVLRGCDPGEPSGDDRRLPTFFRGMAGIAYTFLRLSRTPRLPCVLSMAVEA